MKKIQLIVPLSCINSGTNKSGGVESVCQILVRELTLHAQVSFYYRIVAIDLTNNSKYSGDIIKLSSNVEVVMCPSKGQGVLRFLPSILVCNIRVFQQYLLFKPDLVHSHMLAWVFGAFFSQKIAVTLHGHKDIGRTPVSFLNDLLYARLIPYLARKIVTKYTAVGAALTDYASNDLGKHVSLIYNPVNSEYYINDEDRDVKNNTTHNGVYKLVTCSLLKRAKGIHLCINIVKELASSGMDVYLTVIGPIVDREYYSELVALVNELSLNKRVTFVGALSSEEILKVYKNSSVGLFLSENETFGLVPLEMILSGLPVIVTNVGVLSELRADFCKFKSIRYVDKCLSNVTSDVIMDLITSDYSAAKDYVKANFSPFAIHTKYEAFYGEME